MDGEIKRTGVEKEREGGREREKKEKNEEIPVDGDSTKQRCLIGVGPHQVDRGPPNRVLEDDMGLTTT